MSNSTKAGLALAGAFGALLSAIEGVGVTIQGGNGNVATHVKSGREFLQIFTETVTGEDTQDETGDSTESGEVSELTEALGHANEVIAGLKAENDALKAAAEADAKAKADAAAAAALVNEGGAPKEGEA